MNTTNDSKSSWWSELRRRGMLHVVGLYVVSAWLVLQVIDVITGGLPIPPEALRLVWIGLVLGFPVALLFGWRFDIHRTGIFRTDPHSGEPLPLGRTDGCIIAALGLILLGIAAVTGLRITDAIQDAQLYSDIIAANKAPELKSVAVLPFDACEAGSDDEVLGAALAGEVIGLLSEGGELKVIARTSSFAMRSAGLAIAQIAAPLNVAHVITGTLCRADDSLLLDVELVDAKGFVQAAASFEQIQQQDLPQAETLSAQLSQWVHAQLGGAAPQLADRACNLLDAYQLTLVGREYYARGAIESAKASFEQALALDPGCVDAIAALAVAKVPAWGLAGDDTDIAEQELLLRKALALRPESEHAARALSYVLRRKGSPAEAEQVIRDALVRRPQSAGLYGALGWTLVEQQRHTEAAAAARHSLKLNPAESVGWTALRAAAGKEDLQLLNDWLELDPLNNYPLGLLAWIYFGQGDYHQAMHTLNRLRVLPQFPVNLLITQFRISLLAGRLDDTLEYTLEALEVGGEALNERSVRTHICRTATSVLGPLGFHDEMNHWVRVIDNVEQMPGGQVFCNMNRLKELGNYQDSAQLARGWLDQVGPDWVKSKASRDNILNALLNAGDYQSVVELIEPIPRATWAEIGDATLPLSLLMAHRGLGEDDQAAALIQQILPHIPKLEKQFYSGDYRTSHLTVLLAEAYLLAGRLEDALDTLEIAVEQHYRWPFWRYPDNAWASQADNPRFQEIVEIVEADLARQARRVQAMLAEHDDIDALFAQMVDKPEQPHEKPHTLFDTSSY